jgi:flagellar biosynthetic protein FlhB
MSRQELKDEMKQQEGDQRIKQRQRARAREAARRGIRRAVESADFVIANPTHISVAIRYRVNEGAPVVTAKGYDEVALYIRKLAKDHDIPVIENRPLARALAKRVKPGRPVPVDLYAAVAEILAFVYRLKKRSITSLTGKPRAPRPAARSGGQLRGGAPPNARQ